MALDPVPYAIGGGAAKHTPEVARLIAYAATGAEEGIVAPADLRVTPTAIPGNSVAVGPGAGASLSNYANGSAQTYLSRNNSETLVSIAPTTSSGPRTDLLVLRIEDSYAPGSPWPTPADTVVGPYNAFRVIPNVSANATRMPAGQTGIVLARITVPKSTATITAPMITDLRSIVQAKFKPVQDTTGFNDELVNGTFDNQFRDFPLQWRPTIFIPPWANWATFTYRIAVGTNSTDVDGALRLKFANLISGNSTIDITSNSQGARFLLEATVGGYLNDRIGEPADLVLQAKLSRGALGVNVGSNGSYSGIFEQRRT